MKNILSPSILAADFNVLGEQIKAVKEGGCEYLHVDVMDGMFVPSISFGMPVMESVRKQSDLFFDTHLMIEDPDRYVEEFARCGADGITFHLEAARGSAADVIKHIKNTKSLKGETLRAGISIKPGTPLEEVLPFAADVDMILVMTVEPGFGGQKLIPETLDKVRQLREYLTREGLDTDIEIDGGVTKENIMEICNAGANIIVAGSAVFKGDVLQNTRDFLQMIGG